jgi:hypothetical protein
MCLAPTQPWAGGREVSRGSSGRIVLEIDPQLKSELHAAVALEGRSLKDWFLERARAYVDAQGVRGEATKKARDSRSLDRRTRR